ncbi:MATE family multidrug resistance protein [Sinobacterium caligoides]|uniref:Multidrug-efflux transporter n=1 Tax=Sinobacterium caligoides TaxID=933926 RepID=A0A3N2E0X8_9GAMM|nr:MATE family efflux transporter [Sinobacterium caligoides]ROS05771.1 MATE family multidrug resistance protein [Sinobacterium caligoides]
MPSNFITRELHKLIRLGLPILIAQLAQTAMGVVDTLMSGRYHADDLAAVAIGNSLSLPLLLFIAGVMIGNTAICSHHFGANRISKIGESTRQALWAGLPVALVAIILMLNADKILLLMDAPHHIAVISQHYLYGFALGFPALIGCLGVRTMAEGMGKTRPIMIIGICSFLLNIPLNYIFIYGKFGLPEMGGAGCGLASGIVLWLQLLMFIVFSLRKEFTATTLYERFSWPDWSGIGELFRIGLPIGGAMFVEVILFAAIALILAPMGSTIVGAHQIALNCSGMVFMVPLSLANAITIRVGHTLGQGKALKARAIAYTGIGFAILLAIVSAGTVFLSRDLIATAYTHDPGIQAMAASLLFFAAIYQLPDAIQVCANGALRAYKDTRIPLLLVIISCWLIGLPVGYSLGMTNYWGEPMGAKGFWIGLATGLSCASILLAARLSLISRRSVKKYQRA